VRSSTNYEAQRRFSKAQVEQVVARYEAGATVRELVAEFGFDRTTVIRQLRRNNVELRPHVRKLTDLKVTEAAQLYSTGLSTVKVGAIFGVDAETIRKELIRAGIPLRPRRGAAPAPSLH
jgi:hypothetical protein